MKLLVTLIFGIMAGLFLAHADGAVAIVAPAAVPAVSGIWGWLGGLKDFVLNASILSAIAFILSKFPNSQVAVWLKKLVDFLSSNIQH